MVPLRFTILSYKTRTNSTCHRNGMRIIFQRKTKKNEKAADEMNGSVGILALSQNPETFSNPVILMRK